MVAGSSVRLTKLAVEAVAVGEKDRFVWDSRLSGFGLKVTPKGQRIYIVQYRPRGQATTKRYTLGRHGNPLTAETARHAAEQVLLRVRAGEDPAETDRRRRLEEAAQKAAVVERARTAERLRFEAVVDEFIDLYAKPRNRRWRDTRRILDFDATRVWRGRSLAEISRRDVIELIDDVNARSPSSARALYAQLRRLFAWSVERLYVAQSPFTGLRAPPPLPPRDRWLADHEIVLLWRALSDLGGPLAPLFKVLLLTGQRREEVSGMLWSELDLEKGEWVVGRERAKNGSAHAVDLSDSVKAILRRLPKKSGLVFSTTGGTAPSGHAKYRDRLYASMLNLQAADATKAGAQAAPWRVHDLRRTAATGMAALGHPPHVIEAVLNHRSGSLGGLVAVYQHYQYRKERRQALLDWSDHVGRIVSQSPHSSSANS